MVYVDNLVEFINSIINTQASGTFVAGDAKPISTDELIRMMRKHLGKKEGLISMPSLFRVMIKAIKPDLYIRLFGSYVVDNTGSNQKLNFSPPFSTEFGIGEMVKWYKESIA
jgi:nucleoside-diphosphate-sugar epimerase